MSTTGWTGINEGVDTGNVVEAKFTSAFDNIDAKIDEMDAETLYEFNKVQGVSTTSNAYSALNSLILSASNAPAGTYSFQFNALFNYNSTGRSAFFNISDDGGTTWVEVRKEAKDTTDVNSFDYSYPYVHTGGAIDLKVEYRTESNSDTLNVLGSNIVVERKK